MANLIAFSQSEKTIHNSHKFGFTLSPTNYGYWKAMIQPFLITNNLFGYIDGTIPIPSPTIPVSSSVKDKEDTLTQHFQPNPQHAIWVSNDAHILPSPCPTPPLLHTYSRRNKTATISSSIPTVPPDAPAAASNPPVTPTVNTVPASDTPVPPDEVFNCLKGFIARVELETGKKIRRLRTENGGEFTSNNLEDMCKKAGIQH
ncbi:hypothetical protein E3N88_09692 [Mikania micrantha]|uniref:Retrotransposon Copia-like N-terminal domain-containing protein n=1 Tax=Mikania micrantha TaxID=192012 RepID=A0A5N6PM16_9ASTR|nr:hypothetical protein E3N88_09692 [Mikania micrantha]